MQTKMLVITKQYGIGFLHQSEQYYDESSNYQWYPCAQFPNPIIAELLVWLIVGFNVCLSMMPLSMDCLPVKLKVEWVGW
jgi:hypothetical protein